MINYSENIKKNIEHYNQHYSNLKIETIINKINNLNGFLQDAIITDTSWHAMGLYNFYQNIRGKRILELGCGDGLNALIMASLGANVVAVDISNYSEKIIRKVCEKICLKNIHPITGDFNEIDLKLKYFDFIVGKAFLHHLTHDIERKYLRKMAVLLKNNGEARFFEPAVNSKFLDMIRFIVPVPGRPSMLNRCAFEEWKRNDPHPDRDNSSKHFLKIGGDFFEEVQITLIGTIERFNRIIRKEYLTRPFRRWAHKIEPKLPFWLRNIAARSQLIIYRRPKL